MLMAMIFWRDDASHDAETDTLFAAQASIAPAALGVLLSLVGLLIAGTLKLWPLTATVALWAVGYFAHQLAGDDWRAWLWEAWRFVKQIFVLLVLGVFIVGMVRQVIRPEWIESLAGSNTLPANAVAVGFGVFMYFPTLVEVPVARMFLDLGMHPGPLLALSKKVFPLPLPPMIRLILPSADQSMRASGPKLLNLM